MLLPQIQRKVSHDTVRRWLNAAGVYSCWAAQKPLLSTTNINKRLQFAQKMMTFDWSRVVFSDEKIWRIRPAHKSVEKERGQVRCKVHNKNNGKECWADGVVRHKLFWPNDLEKMPR
jgi:hypothetical protein